MVNHSFTIHSQAETVINNRAAHLAALPCYLLPLLIVSSRMTARTSVRSIPLKFRDRCLTVPTDQPWLSRYTKLVYNVMVSTFGSNRPPYPHILQFDTAVRNFPIIPKMHLSDWAGKREEGPSPPGDINIVQWLGVSNKESGG